MVKIAIQKKIPEVKSVGCYELTDKYSIKGKQDKMDVINSNIENILRWLWK